MIKISDLNRADLNRPTLLPSHQKCVLNHLLTELKTRFSFYQNSSLKGLRLDPGTPIGFSHSEALLRPKHFSDFNLCHNELRYPFWVHRELLKLLRKNIKLLRCTVTNTCLTGFALLHVHRNVDEEPQNIVYEFARKITGRLEFISNVVPWNSTHTFKDFFLLLEASGSPQSPVSTASAFRGSCQPPLSQNPAYSPAWPIGKEELLTNKANPYRLSNSTLSFEIAQTGVY